MAGVVAASVEARLDLFVRFFTIASSSAVDRSAAEHQGTQPISGIARAGTSGMLSAVLGKRMKAEQRLGQQRRTLARIQAEEHEQRVV